MRNRQAGNISRLTPTLVVASMVLVFGGLTAHSNVVDTLLSLIIGINGNRISIESTRNIQYLHPDMVRLDGFPWDIVQARKGAYDYTVPDTALKWARDTKQSVLGIIQYAPAWANEQNFKTPKNLSISSCGIPDLGNSDTSFNRLRTYPPKDKRDFGAYAYALAKRYPDVGYWQIWNEPNNPIFWPTGPNADEYAQMLKASYGTIKKANPGASVVLGGISLNDLEYVRELYAAGAKAYFDIMAVHLYNPGQAPSAYLAQELEKLHALMARYGDSTKTIWLTEIGWHTGTAPSAVSEQQQSQYLEQTITIAHSKAYVGAVFWNTLMDCDRGYDTANPEHSFGIFKNTTPKPAAAVMRGMMLKK
jgi:hypothetical protein